MISPLAGIELASKIKEHHIYVTGSINEPSGNHHIEGAQCGLPLLFINSGGIVEYCKNYGIQFNGLDDFETSLNELVKMGVFFGVAMGLFHILILPYIVKRKNRN